MVFTSEKSNPISTELESIDAAMIHEPKDRADTVEPYTMTWRTLAGFLALSMSWSSSSFAITGPNASIGYIAAAYPDQAHNASWIANSPILCIIALTGTFGATSDRYGKKWFLLIGGTISIVGSLVSAYATSMNMVIAGSVIAGIGGAALNQAVPAGLEIVPAKYRTAEAALAAVINGSLGIIGGIAVFSACIQHGLGWRWGYKIQAILSGLAVISTALFYHPPPTRFREEGKTFMNLLKSVDFIGTALLALGAVLITLALNWGGTQYAWSSAHVVPFLVIGPIVLIIFGLYEWKGRTDGILHHDFFESRTFPIFVFYGFVDGIILYGTSVFIPNQSRSVYHTKPLAVARAMIIFSSTLLAGFLLAGYVTTKTKQLRLPLIVGSAALALFSGLVVRAHADVAYFEAFVGLAGLCVGATEIIPIGAISLVVPSYLIATSSMVFVTCRGLGGVMGIAIFTAIYSNKAAVSIPENVIPVLAKAEISPDEYAIIINTVVNAPAALAKFPDLTATIIEEIITASKKGASESYVYIWYCIMAVALALLLLAFFVKDVPHKMTNQVETTLERDLKKTDTVGTREVEV